MAGNGEILQATVVGVAQLDGAGVDGNEEAPAPQQQQKKPPQQKKPVPMGPGGLPLYVGDWNPGAGEMNKDGCFGFAMKSYACLAFTLVCSSSMGVVALEMLKDWHEGTVWMAENEVILIAALCIFFGVYFIHVMACVFNLNPLRRCWLALMKCPGLNFLVLAVVGLAFGCITTRLGYTHSFCRAFFYLPWVALVSILAQMLVLWLAGDVQTMLIPMASFILPFLLCIGVGIVTVYEDYTEYPEHCYWTENADYWRAQYGACEREEEADASNIPFRIFLAFLLVLLPVVGLGIGVSLNMMWVFRPQTERAVCCTNGVDYTRAMYALMALDMFYELCNYVPGFACKAIGKMPRHRYRYETYYGHERDFGMNEEAY